MAIPCPLGSPPPDDGLLTSVAVAGPEPLLPRSVLLSLKIDQLRREILRVYCENEFTAKSLN